MGYLQEKHGIMMLKRTPEGTCSICAVKHDPRLPHNRDSLAYQYNFYDQHGRFPSWADAMAHCDPAVKAAWTELLEENGVKVDELKERRETQ
jgi:predicted glycoside hydrolase/deacetylase ChbG (UPF0249 family)